MSNHAADLDPIGPATVIARSPEILEAELDGETVMMSIEQGEYYGLDQVGTSIWSLLAEPRSVAELCAALVEEYEVDPEICQRDVIAFLEQLAGDGTVRVVESSKPA